MIGVIVEKDNGNDSCKMKKHMREAVKLELQGKNSSVKKPSLLRTAWL